MAQTKAQLVVGLDVNASAPASALQIDASGNVNLDSNTLYVDATNNRVGIGTSSPASTLHSVGTTILGTGTYPTGSIGLSDARTAILSSTENQILIIGNTNATVGADKGAEIYLGAKATTGSENLASAKIGGYKSNATSGNFESHLAFSTSNSVGTSSEKVRIDSSGRVGIGTTTVNTTLEVLNSSTPIIRVGDGTRHMELRGGSTTQNAAIGTNYAGGFDIIQNGSAAATIDSSKRVLVGTSTATNNLRLDAKLAVVSTGSGNFGGVNLTNYGGTGAGTASFIDFNRSRGTTDGSFTSVAASDALGYIVFRGATGSAFEVFAQITAEVDGTPGVGDAPGRLVFSTTVDGASAPAERMRIGNQGNISIYSAGEALYVSTSLASGTANALIMGFNSGLGSSSLGTNCFQVLTNGNVRNTNNSYTAISDIKLKENIVHANSQWDDIKALQVRNYNLKEGQTHKQIGLIAQEVEPISPGLVYETPDRDEEGNDLGTSTKSVNYSVLYMKAVKALQEAMERIETLEAKVAALESA